MGISSTWSKQKLVYQLIIARLSVDNYFEDTQYRANIIDLVKNGIGGFCIFDGNTDNVPKLVEQLQAIATIPLIFAADFENGLPMRLTEGTAFPHAMAIGKSNDYENSYKIASAIAKECQSIGINWNFAPVCDINSNPNNPIINIRAFGEDSDVVSHNAVRYIKGSQENNIIACAKHFPGHGDTATDSHISLPIIESSLDSLLSNELKPFISAIENDVWSMMIAHIYVKAFDADTIPASLSKNVISYLKDELKYDGLILTDALDMKAITHYIDENQAAYYALLAGNDIALIPTNPELSANFIIQKLENDNNFRYQLEKSADKLYKVKRKCGLIPQYAILDKNTQIFNTHLKLALEIAYKAASVVGDKSLIPIKEKVNFASFAILQKDTDLQAANRFFTMLAQALENDCDFAFINNEISNEDVDEFVSATKDAEYVIFPIFIKSHSYHGSVAIEENLKTSMNKLSKGKKRIIILFGSPYLKNELEYDLLISTYSDSFASLATAVIYLSGRDESLKY
ncbi:MAG TPA: glycoside hydrolase family 3 N-terminal domain-containing protein [Candidatus Kapabacteria bacterium]|nr:glycoside hydrolase family 3 N-terminal domain-containing protein [Candidatus Kapabacteria bacterium]